MSHLFHRVQKAVVWAHVLSCGRAGDCDDDAAAAAAAAAASAAASAAAAATESLAVVTVFHVLFFLLLNSKPLLFSGAERVWSAGVEHPLRVQRQRLGHLHGAVEAVRGPRKRGRFKDTVYCFKVHSSRAELRRTSD